MRLESKWKKQVEETKYLSQDNTWRYRAIIRAMYYSYEKMKYVLYREEIMDLLQMYEEFEDYSMENLRSDLDVLTSWNNLIARSDSSKVKSIEEFKNKEFAYQLAPYTIEIERMLLVLENMTVENNASLEASLVERYRNDLSELDTIMDKEAKEIYNWWKRLNSDFRELNQNYQDYISRFYSPKTEEMIKTTEFLLYKEGFINYLRDFIRGLQINSLGIKEILRGISDEDINKIIDTVYMYEKNISAQEVREAEYKEINIGRFISMKEWFLSYKNRAPLIEQLIDNTNEIIRRITRFAAQIADKRGNSANRKEEYRKLAELFEKCATIEEANKLSSISFGVFSMRHVKANPIRETESINSSIYEEEPTRIFLKPRVRTYRERQQRTPIKDKSEAKKEKLNAILERRKLEEELIGRLIVNNKIDFGNLPVLSTQDRTVLLRWLARAMSMKSSQSKTEYGRAYRLIGADIGADVKVTCQDGVFTMPHFLIEFKE